MEAAGVVAGVELDRFSEYGLISKNAGKMRDSRNVESFKILLRSRNRPQQNRSQDAVRDNCRDPKVSQFDCTPIGEVAWGRRCFALVAISGVVATNPVEPAITRH
jgi:hypothetical protein